MIKESLNKLDIPLTDGTALIAIDAALESLLEYGQGQDNRIRKLEQQLQEKGREIVELKNKIDIRSAFLRRLFKRLDIYNNAIRDIQDFKSKFMDFMSRSSLPPGTLQAFRD